MKFFLILLFSLNSYANCEKDILNPKDRLTNNELINISENAPREITLNFEAEVSKECQSACSQVKLSTILINSINKAFDKIGVKSKKIKGYSIIVATMVTSAAINATLIAHLPKHLQFLSFAVGQLSTIGMIVFGAPFWEPLSSAFRRVAFGVSEEARHTDNIESNLEHMWRRAQVDYSINAQMSRNVMTTLLPALQANMYLAFQAFKGRNKKYAIDQIALSALQFRQLFAEVLPKDELVYQVVRGGFANHLRKPELLIPDVLKQIQKMDKEYEDPYVLDFYSELINFWLQPQS